MYRGIRKTLTVAGVILLIWAFVTFFLPLCLPFLLGGALALGAEPMVGFLCRRLRLPRSAAALLGVTGALCLLVLLVSLVLALILRELAVLVSVLPDLEQAAAGGISALSGWALRLVSRLPGSIGTILERNVREFFSESSQLLSQGLRYVVSLTGGLLSQVPDSALVLGTAAISSYMISARIPVIREWLRQKISRERIRKFLDTLGGIRAAMAGWLKAQLKLMGITWIVLTLGFVLLRIPYAPVWAGAVSLVDAFPILGVGTVLLPWSLVCFLQADTARALGLLGIYAVIGLGRSALEPKLVGRQLGLDPLVTLAALYTGYRLWGLGGMLFAPVLAVLAVQLTRDPAA